MRNLSVLLLVAIAAFASAFTFVTPAASFSQRMILQMTSPGRKPLMGGNWKLNPRTLSKATTLSSDLAKLAGTVTDVDICVFPPHPFLVPVQQQIAGTTIQLGGQNCFFENEGAYTGAVSPCMLKDIGVSYVLCGHSERRTVFKDDDGAIGRKLNRVLAEGMKPVLCLGETLEEYEAGLNHEVCAVQMLKDIKDVTPEQMRQIVIAYEPVWSIGTGLVCPSSVAQEVHSFIRSIIAKKYGSEIADGTIIQYGGSVKPDNVKEIMSMPDIDGCLVGGASLTADSFAKIINYKA